VNRNFGRREEDRRWRWKKSESRSKGISSSELCKVHKAVELDICFLFIMKCDGRRREHLKEAEAGVGSIGHSHAWWLLAGALRWDGCHGERRRRIGRSRRTRQGGDSEEKAGRSLK
jgi:hypothetical protein